MISRRRFQVLSGIVFVVSLGQCVALAALPDETHFGRWDRFAGGGAFSGVSPSMAPDGSAIVYASPRTAHGDIYKVNRDGSGTVRLTSDPNYEGDPQYSPDGKTIVFVTHSIQEALFLGSKCAVLTAGPARMADFFAVPLPYPRTLEAKTSPAFGVLTKRVYELLGMK